MTSFSSFFDARKCEGCKEGVMVRGGDWDEQVLDCPEPCPREDDVDYVEEKFYDWMDNVSGELKMEDYVKMAAAMDNRFAENDEYDFFYLRDKAQFSDDGEAFYAWLDANKSIFTAKDYFEMGGAV